MGSPCLFTRQRTLKIAYFCLLRVKNSNHLARELSLGYPRDTKFYLQSNASFIDISSIALFTTLFNNTRTLKLKAQPTNAFFAAVNQVFGGSSQLTTTAEPYSLSELCTTI